MHSVANGVLLVHLTSIHWYQTYDVINVPIRKLLSFFNTFDVKLQYISQSFLSNKLPLRRQMRVWGRTFEEHNFHATH